MWLAMSPFILCEAPPTPAVLVHQVHAENLPRFAGAGPRFGGECAGLAFRGHAGLDGPVLVVGSVGSGVEACGGYYFLFVGRCSKRVFSLDIWMLFPA